MDKELIKVLNDLLKENLAPIKNDISNMKSDISNMKSDISNMKSDISNMKSDISNTKSDISNMKSDISNTKSDIDNIKGDLKALKSQQEENTAILRSLEHKADVNKAEHDKLFNEVARLSGNIENMRKDLSAVEVVTARNMENIAQLKLVK